MLKQCSYTYENSQCYLQAWYERHSRGNGQRQDLVSVILFKFTTTIQTITAFCHCCTVKLYKQLTNVSTHTERDIYCTITIKAVQDFRIH